MADDARKLCVTCAWRENCAKKFSMDSSSMHCPDYSEDVALRKRNEEQDSQGKEEEGQNQ
jgi:hypothetical protein